MDFDDLIVRTVELLRACPDVAEYYHRKFRYILVDEYQDTNHAQYVLIRELAGVDHARLDQPLFERPRLRVRTVHDGDVAVAHAVIRVQAFDLRGDPMCFELRGIAVGAGRVGPAWITVVGDSDQSIYAFRGADISRALVRLFL
mgnify:CR=1 FL=1